MPKVGEGVDAVEYPYTQEGVEAAEKHAQATGQQVDYSGIPMNNGAERSVKTYAGGGMTGYNIVDKYEEGGKVDKKLRKNRGMQIEDEEALKDAQKAHIQNRKDFEDGKIPKRVYESRNKTLYNKIMLLTGQKEKVKLKEGGKVDKGITGEYDAVLDEGGYESEVKKQKARLTNAEFRKWWERYKKSKLTDKFVKKVRPDRAKKK